MARIGVLALQGAFQAHADRLVELGADVVLVRRPEQLSDLDGIVLPGGESTTMSNLLVSSGLASALRDALTSGLPVFGTCAGLILLANRIQDGRADQICFGALDATVRRNAYGRQVDSFETDLDIGDARGSFHAVFIRAPAIVETGTHVAVLARHHDTPVLVRTPTVLAASFHPELTPDSRIHRIFLDLIEETKR